MKLDAKRKVHPKKRKIFIKTLAKSAKMCYNV